MHQRADLVAHFPHFHVGADGRNFAGDFQPRQVGGVGRRRVLAQALLHVRAVHARGGHLDEDLVRLWYGIGAFGRNQDFRTAGLADLDAFHGLRIIAKQAP